MKFDFYGYTGPKSYIFGFSSFTHDIELYKTPNLRIQIPEYKTSLRGLFILPPGGIVGFTVVVVTISPISEVMPIISFAIRSNRPTNTAAMTTAYRKVINFPD